MDYDNLPYSIINRTSDAALGTWVWIQFKKSFEQFEDSNWYYESRGDEKIYDSTVDHINEQMKQEKRDFLNKTIQKLGFKEEKDYDGQVVLKNNVPIKRSMTYRQVEDLITRLKVTPKPQPRARPCVQPSATIKK